MKIKYEVDLPVGPFFPKPKVFISYSHVDIGNVMRLYSSLTKNGFDCFLDKADHGLPVKRDFNDALKNEIKSRHCFIACISNNNVNGDGYVQQEWEYALDLEEKEHPDLSVIRLCIDKKAEIEILKSVSRLTRGTLVPYYNFPGNSDDIRLYLILCRRYAIPVTSAKSKGLFKWAIEVVIGDEASSSMIVSNYIFWLNVRASNKSMTFKTLRKYSEEFDIDYPFKDGYIRIKILVSYNKTWGTIKSLDITYEGISILDKNME